jgi:hypothetical protein
VNQIAIIGGARVVWRDFNGDLTSRPSHDEERDIPWDDADWQKWSCNALYEAYPDESLIDSTDAAAFADAHFPFHAWFQLHTPAYMRKHWNTSYREWPAHEEWLRKEHPFPVYMQKKYKAYPSSVRFPKEKVETLHKLGRYQTFTFSWMLAFAIAEGADRIALFGVDADTGEPLAARACLEFWVGYALGRGIDVEVVTPNPRIFRTVHAAELYSDLQYAYEDEPWIKIKPDGWQDVRVK